MPLCHQATLAENSTLSASRRWPWLSEQCTWAKCSRPPGTPLAPPPAPPTALCLYICLKCRFDDTGGRGRGRAWCSGTCLHEVSRAHRHLLHHAGAPHSCTACPASHVQQARQPAMVHGEGGRASLVAGEGMVKVVVCKTRTFGNAPCLHLGMGDIHAISLPPSPPHSVRLMICSPFKHPRADALA